MEVTFTLTLGLTFVALLVTFLILLKGTRNFVYRTAGLISFVILLVTITVGYLDLMGKPKPLTYETWYFEEAEQVKDGNSDKGNSEGEAEQLDEYGDGGDSGGNMAGMMSMDILKWEHDAQKGEAYLWMRKEQKTGEQKETVMNYSFDTTTEAGKKLLKQLRKAEREAMRRGMRGSRGGTTGIKLRIIIDRLIMADTERFEFFVPPPKLLPPKFIPQPGTYFPPSGRNPNARPGGR